MPALFLVLIVRVFIEIINATRARKVSKPLPLCTACSHAHVQYAANGRRAIACTYGGGVRPMVLDVMYCTDYQDRTAVPRLVSIGFALPIADAETANALEN